MEAPARAHLRARPSSNHADREVEGSVASLRDTVRQLAGAESCLSSCSRRRGTPVPGNTANASPQAFTPPPPATGCTQPMSPTTSTTSPPGPAYHRSDYTICGTAPATMDLAAGVQLKVIFHRLHHSSPHFTAKYYGDVLPELSHAADAIVPCGKSGSRA